MDWRGGSSAGEAERKEGNGRGECAPLIDGVGAVDPWARPVSRTSAATRRPPAGQRGRAWIEGPTISDCGAGKNRENEKHCLSGFVGF